MTREAEDELLTAVQAPSPESRAPDPDGSAVARPALLFRFSVSVDRGATERAAKDCERLRPDVHLIDPGPEFGAEAGHRPTAFRPRAAQADGLGAILETFVVILVTGAVADAL